MTVRVTINIECSDIGDLDRVAAAIAACNAVALGAIEETKPAKTSKKPPSKKEEKKGNDDPLGLGDDDPKAVTKDDISAAVRERIEEEGEEVTAEIKAIFAKFKAKNLSALKEKHYAAVLAAIQDQ